MELGGKRRVCCVYTSSSSIGGAELKKGWKEGFFSHYIVIAQMVLHTHHTLLSRHWVPQPSRTLTIHCLVGTGSHSPLEAHLVL